MQRKSGSSEEGVLCSASQGAEGHGVGQQKYPDSPRQRLRGEGTGPLGAPEASWAPMAAGSPRGSRCWVQQLFL
ncbi:hypothetical protein NDU88_011496 [Pleurodeles waltl]|uniref:Uncharacterized protein n=1 Tax=Pleurodeles waltl TaxID=8319 RepID=A0AAV7PZ09_PLEWA|nr:hypothetical protein NDU88_011496 [Pleurodeles waltl]